MTITVTIHATITDPMYRLMLQTLTEEQFRAQLQARCPAGVTVRKVTIAIEAGQ